MNYVHVSVSQSEPIVAFSLHFCLKFRQSSDDAETLDVTDHLYENFGNHAMAEGRENEIEGVEDGSAIRNQNEYVAEPVYGNVRHEIAGLQNIVNHRNQRTTEMPQKNKDHQAHHHHFHQQFLQ